MEVENDITGIFEIFRRRLGIILAVFLSVAIIGGGISILSNEKEYSSTVSLLVGKEEEIEIRYTDEEGEIILENISDEELRAMSERLIVYGNTNISNQAKSFYNEAINNKELLEDVIADLNLNMSVDNLRKKVSMKIPEDSGVIKLEVAGVGLSNADKIVDKLAENFIDYVYQITELENIKIINNGSKPKYSNTENIKLNIAIFMTIGLISGIFCAFVIDFLDDRIRSGEDLESKLGIQILGNINDGNNKDNFRNIRTNIQFANNFKDKKTLVCTSLSSKISIREFSSELSRAIAKGNEKVLLIDGDFRNPRLHEEFNLSNEDGLSDILLGKYNFEEIVNKYEDEINLDILTTGKTNEKALELLSSNKMKNVLSNLYNNYDFIIIKSHPLNNVMDSVALANMADGIILGLKTKDNKIKEVKSAKKFLERVGVNTIGAILED